MAINPSIALQVRQPETFDPLEDYGRVLNLRQAMEGAGLQRQLRQESTERVRLQNEAARQQQSEQEQIRRALGGLGGDFEKAPDALRGLGTPSALKMADDLEKTLDARKTAALAQEEKEIDIALKGAARLASIAGTVTDEATRDTAVGQMLREKRIDKEQAFELLNMPFNDEFKNQLKQLQEMTLTAQQKLDERRKAIEEQRKAQSAPFEQRKLEAETLKAEREEKEGSASGEIAEFKNIFAPGYYAENGIREPSPKDALDAYRAFQKEKHPAVSGRDIPLPPDVEAQRKRMNASRAEKDGLSPTQFNRVQVLASQFDQKPVVKDFIIVANKYDTVKEILGKPGGVVDVAIIYEFMKALDPTSVVRESEFETLSKSGNIFLGWAAKFNGYMKAEGGVLPEQMRKDFMAILDKKMGVSQKQVKGIYQDFARRIDVITAKPGTGSQYLTDYAEVLQDQTPSTPGKPRIKILSVK